MGDGMGVLITNGLGGDVAIASISRGVGGESLQIAEAAGDVSVLQVEARMPELRA